MRELSGSSTIELSSEEIELDLWPLIVGEWVGSILDSKVQEMHDLADMPFLPDSKKGKKHHALLKKTTAEISSFI
ncbi:MAG: hypothetical protein ACREAY_04830 [Nitrososphaera sp.]|uniref:hypothetical protein n=1 Tax=Nitrososphaera sp. TaxID=1971748 RepID=UPI003D6ED003